MRAREKNTRQSLENKGKKHKIENNHPWPVERQSLNVPFPFTSTTTTTKHHKNKEREISSSFSVEGGKKGLHDEKIVEESESAHKAFASIYGTESENSNRTGLQRNHTLLECV